MISGLVQILFFQGTGEVLSHLFLPRLPGPVIGLVLLLAWLFLRGKVDEPLSLVADTLGRHLGLLFIPAAVGVVLYLPQLRGNALGIALALVTSVAATLAVTALVLYGMSGNWRRRNPHADR